LAKSPFIKHWPLIFNPVGGMVRLANEILLVVRALCGGCFGVALPGAAILFGSPASTGVRGIFPQPSGR